MVDNTYFGLGCTTKRTLTVHCSTAELERTKVNRSLKDKAYAQLGTAVRATILWNGAS